MKTQDLQALSSDLIGVMVVGRELPAYIFSKKFKNHLFFDADITTSDELICAIREMVLMSVGTLLPVAVFSSKTREVLSIFAPDENWEKNIIDLTKSMHERGNYYGYIIVDSSLRWVAYQTDPVSLGVFAFDGKNPWSEVSQDTRDCFVNRRRMEDLFISESMSDIDLINIFGREYIFELINNYS